MDFIRELFEDQPLLVLFLTIAIGYVVGEINLKGLSLGVGAVLFVGLAVGWFAPKSAPPAILGNFGLSLFLYAVGVQYGRQFFLGLSSIEGLKANFLALTGVLLAGTVSVLLIKVASINPGYAMGLFAGSGTSTPTLQAAIAALGNDDPAVGYSVAYPFGVAGPILYLYLASIIWRPKFDVTVGSGVAMLEIGLRRPEFFGKRLAEMTQVLPADVQIVALRRDHHNQPASPNSIIAENDVLLAVAPTAAVLEQARQRLGEAAPGSLTQDRKDLDYLRVFASRPAIVGRMLVDLELPGQSAAVVAHVRRGDTDLQARPDLVLEFGDRVGLLANRADFSAMRTYFGDSIKGTAEFSYVSIGLGMAMGILLGVIPIPLPGLAKITLGLSGVLIVGLILGNRRRTAGLNWTMPLSANLVLRNLGLTVFLAQVGMSSGPKFAATVAETGLLLIGLGAIVLSVLVVSILVLGLLVLRMPFDEVAGIITGATGSPAVLAFANKVAPTDRPDIGYATIFPGMTIVKILFAGIASGLL